MFKLRQSHRLFLYIRNEISERSMIIYSVVVLYEIMIINWGLIIQIQSNEINQIEEQFYRIKTEFKNNSEVLNYGKICKPIMADLISQL